MHPSFYPVRLIYHTQLPLAVQQQAPLVFCSPQLPMSPVFTTYPPFSQLQQPVQYYGQARQVPQSQQQAQYFQVVPGNPYSQYTWAIQPSKASYSLPQRQQTQYFQTPTQVSYEQNRTVPSYLHHPMYSQGPINYTIPTTVRVLTSYTPQTSFEMPQQQPPQQPPPPPQQPQQPQQPADEKYIFSMDKDPNSNKINFFYKGTKAPLFWEYFGGIRGKMGIAGYKDRGYESALVLEQKIKAYGVLSEGNLDIKNLDIKELKTTLKDSADTKNNKIATIFDKNEKNEDFKKAISATLQKGINLKGESTTEANTDANKLRVALLNNNLSKEEAGQIAKAISILDDGTPKDRRIATTINNLVGRYTTRQQFQTGGRS